nr:EOG090X05X4 [Macrothrix elegans]
MNPKSDNSVLRYEGCNFFRQRLLLATLACRPVSIINIRSKDSEPGLREFEASFIRLLDKITNGSKIEVNQTGTAVFYEPGLLYGGTIEHDCSVQRSIAYYLEPIMALAPFCKKPLKLTLRGVTCDQTDPSIDVLRCSSLPVLKRFLLVDEGLEFNIIKRGAAPKGGGEVVFCCPIRRELKPLQFIDPGKIKKIRGVAFAMRTSPTMTNRMVESAKGILLKYIPDVFILTDHRKSLAGGLSPGFGITLTAETTNGAFLSAEAVSNPQGESPSLPEDLGEKAALLLLEEIYRGGCVDSSNQFLVLLLMALGPKDVSQVLIGPLSPYTIQFLRHLKDFFGVMYKMDLKHEEDESQRTGTDKILMTCVGHSVSVGNNSSLSNDFLSKPRFTDLPKPFIPQTTIINRFVEEQEPYDTGSDSENDCAAVTRHTPKKNWFSSLWASKTSTGTPSKNPTVMSRIKGKLNILWQWQFVAVVLPLLAVLFFLVLAAAYIRASFNETGSSVDSAVDPNIILIKNYLEKDAAAKLCGGEETTTVDSSVLSDQLQLSATVLEKTDEGTAGPTSGTTNVSPRPKVWQGQAFSTDSTGVNSPPPYPLTQCLKVRNMFDTEV